MSHTPNDLHARLSPRDNHNRGFAYLAAVIRREHANCHYRILLNAGDPVQGTPVSTIFHGLPVYEIANLLGFDAASCCRPATVPAEWIGARPPMWARRC